MVLWWERCKPTLVYYHVTRATVKMNKTVQEPKRECDSSKHLASHTFFTKPSLETPPLSYPSPIQIPKLGRQYVCHFPFNNPQKILSALALSFRPKAASGRSSIQCSKQPQSEWAYKWNPFTIKPDTQIAHFYCIRQSQHLNNCKFLEKSHLC